MTRVRSCIRHQAYQEGCDLLTRLIDHLNVQNRVLDVVEALILSAICKRHMELDQDTWQQLLREGIELAETYGYVAVFAEMSAAILPLLKEISLIRHKEFLAQLRRAAEAQAQRYPGYLVPFNVATAEHPELSADFLVEQERMLFDFICLRKTNGEICKSMGIGINHLSQLTNRLYEKLHTKSRKRIREIGMVFLGTGF